MSSTGWLRLMTPEIAYDFTNVRRACEPLHSPTQRDMMIDPAYGLPDLLFHFINQSSIHYNVKSQHSPTRAGGIIRHRIPAARLSSSHIQLIEAQSLSRGMVSYDQWSSRFIPGSYEKAFPRYRQRIEYFGMGSE